MVNDLLDLAKMEKVAFSLNVQEFNMFDLVTTLYQALVFQANAKKIKLLVEYDQGRPFILQRLFGDSARIQ
jgi:signal transduction histidine kinase